METTVLSCADPGNLAVAIEAACRCLSAGEVVGLPAETVYGLAGDALNPAAAARIFEAKARPFFDPLICHLPDLDWLARMTVIPPSVRALVDAACAYVRAVRECAWWCVVPPATTAATGG